MLLGLILVPIVNLFTRVRNKTAVEEMFGCYNKNVTVKAATALIFPEDGAAAESCARCTDAPSEAD